MTRGQLLDLPLKGDEPRGVAVPLGTNRPRGTVVVAVDLARIVGRRFLIVVNRFDLSLC
jgi:hypothetical protein